MANFFARYASLCKEKKKTPNGVAKELGIPSASVTNWKKGATPRAKSIEQIAAYFGVSADYLMGSTEARRRTVEENGDLISRAEALIGEMDRDQLLDFIAKATEKLREK
ncbi:MAG: helix-turn-helix domain-containing protein [Clostridiales bacterium]|nr:helix-turn-helix domain-containing protein [Clostridiales bacterium]